MSHDITPTIRRGFTLIEILIVVVILSILAAIIVPQFAGASEEAAESSIKSTLKAVRTQIEVYRMYNDGEPPDSLDDLINNPDRHYILKAPVAPNGYVYSYNNGEFSVACTNPGAAYCPGDIGDW